MEQRSKFTYAAAKVAQTKLYREECVRGMGQRSRLNCAAVKVAQIKSSTEECALSMEQSSKDAPVKDAQI